MAGAWPRSAATPSRRDFRHIDPTEATRPAARGRAPAPPGLPAELERRGQAASSAARRRGPDRDARHRHPSGCSGRRGRTHPDADGALGGRRRGQPAAARRSASPLDRIGPGRRRARLHHPRPPRGVRARRRGRLRPSGRRPVPGSPRRRSRWAEYAAPHHPERPGRAAAEPFRYWDKGSARHDRPRARRSPTSGSSTSAASSPGWLDLRPHLLPDRLPQPGARAVPVGLVLHHVQPRRPAHHRRRTDARPRLAPVGIPASSSS